MTTTDELGFVDRHLGPDEAEIAEMLAAIGRASLDELIGATVPAAILRDHDLELPAARSEAQALDDLRAMAAANTPLRSMLGHGLPRHAHAAGDPAEHPREPGLVHRLHAVPGRDRPGPARGADQLPDVVAT